MQRERQQAHVISDEEKEEEPLQEVPEVNPQELVREERSEIKEADKVGQQLDTEVAELITKGGRHN